MEETDESLKSPKIEVNKPKRPMSASGGELKNRLAQISKHGTADTNFRPLTAPSNEKVYEIKEEADIDDLLIENKEDWKFLFSGRPRTSHPSKLSYKSVFTSKLRPQSAITNIKPKSFNPKPSYSINAFSLCEILKKVKSSSDEMIFRNSSPKLIDIQILHNLKRNTTSKGILSLNADDPSTISFKCLELEESAIRSRPQTAGRIPKYKPASVAKKDEEKEKEEEQTKNKAFLHEVLNILTENTKEEKSNEVINKNEEKEEISQKEKKSFGIKLPRSSNKNDREINTSSQDDVSSRLSDTLKTIEKLTERSSNIIEKKSNYSLSKINEVEQPSTTERGKQNKVFLFKAWKNKLSIKTPKVETEIDDPHDLGASLRIHSLRSPNATTELTIRSKQSFASPRVRPKSAYIQSSTYRRENPAKTEIVIPAPFSVALRGKKVEECNSFGIMFKPSTTSEKRASLPISTIAIKRAKFSNKLVK